MATEKKNSIRVTPSTSRQSIPELGDANPDDVVNAVGVVLDMFGMRKDATPTHEKIMGAALAQANVELGLLEAHLDRTDPEWGHLLSGIRSRLWLAAEFGSTLSQVITEPEVQS
jgi:hypothetical protein